MNKLTAREYAKIINRLFKFLKKVLSNEVYNSIKKHFCIDVNRLINKGKSYVLKTIESKSSIFNCIKTNSSNTNSTITNSSITNSNNNKGNNERILKLSCDFTNVSLREKDREIKVKLKNRIELIDKKKEKSPLLIITTNDDNNINESLPCIQTTNDAHLITLSENTVNGNMLNDDNTNMNNDNYSETQLKQSLYYLTKSSRAKTPTIMKNLKMPINAKAHNNNNNTKQINKNKKQSHSKSSSRENIPRITNHNHNYNKIVVNNNSDVTTPENSNRNNKTSYISAIKNNKEAITPSKNINPTTNVNLNQKQQREILNINVSKILISPKGIETKPHPLLNGKLFSKLKNDSSSNHNSSKKPSDPDGNKREISLEAINLFSNTKTQRCFKSSVLSTKRITKFNSKILNKSTGTFTINPYTTKSKQIRTQYIDLTRTDENRISPKNDDMMKQIKMSLDDNLRYMFNFSYEHFLSKESESQSKQSQDLNEISL